MENSGEGRPEKRKFKRAPASFALLYAVKAPFEVRIQIGNTKHNAIALDLGEGGMALAVSYKIPEAAIVGLEFTIFNDLARRQEDRSRFFALDGEVRYCVLLKKMDWRLGVRFVSISEEERAYITNYVQTNLLKPAPSP